MSNPIGFFACICIKSKFHEMIMQIMKYNEQEAVD